MQKKNISWNEVLYSDFKFHENLELQEVLQSQKLEVFLQDVDNNTLVVLGWDGTLLEALSLNYRRKMPFLGINFWNKWFLLNDVWVLDSRNSLERRDYSLLEMCIDGSVCAVALNEFDIKAGDGKMLDLKISVWEGHILSLLGDGIIVSTPIGSTGYNSSLWGPILPHNSNSYILTPKAPWKPKGLSPIIFSDSEVLTIETQGRQSPIELYADGRIVEKYDHENISLSLRKSSVSVTFLVSCEQSCSWDDKVFEEQWFQKILS